MTTGIALLFLIVLSVCEVSGNITSRTADSCLTWLTTLVHPQTSSVGADIDEFGCYSDRQLGLENVSLNVTSQFWRQSVAPLSDKIACAANCSARKPRNSRVQFAIAYGECLCDIATQGKAAKVSDACCSTTPTPQPSVCTAARYGIVYELILSCRIRDDDCLETPRCESNSGCCVPEGSVPEDVPFHITLMQWMASFLMIAIVLQAIWWSVRLRLRSRNDPSGGLLDVPMRRVPQRSKDEAVRQARAALPQFSPPHRGEIDSEAHCGICLEKLCDAECLRTSCSHLFHRSCLSEYLAHGLRSMTNDIVCPMCRSILVVQFNSPPSNDDGEGGVPLLQPPSIVVINAERRGASPLRREDARSGSDDDEVLARL